MLGSWDGGEHQACWMGKERIEMSVTWEGEEAISFRLRKKRQ